MYGGLAGPGWRLRSEPADAARDVDQPMLADSGSHEVDITAPIVADDDQGLDAKITLGDMPIDSDPPTITAAAARAKADAARRSSRVDVALWGGLVPQSVGRLAEHPND